MYVNCGHRQESVRSGCGCGRGCGCCYEIHSQSAACTVATPRSVTKGRIQITFDISIQFTLQ
jgi:hypothetical protein